jgi:hypothetical protein
MLSSHLNNIISLNTSRLNSSDQTISANPLSKSFVTENDSSKRFGARMPVGMIFIVYTHWRPGSRMRFESWGHCLRIGNRVSLCDTPWKFRRPGIQFRVCLQFQRTSSQTSSSWNSLTVPENSQLRWVSIWWTGATETPRQSLCLIQVPQIQSYESWSGEIRTNDLSSMIEHFGRYTFSLEWVISWPFSVHDPLTQRFSNE